MKISCEKNIKKRSPKYTVSFQISFLKKLTHLQEKWRKEWSLQCRAVIFTLSLLLLSTPVYADDPLTSGSTWLSGLIFGGLGITMCSIVLAVNFYMAKIGKVSWDKFMHDALCICGFIGAPSIVALIISAIRH